MTTVTTEKHSCDRMCDRMVRMLTIAVVCSTGSANAATTPTTQTVAPTTFDNSKCVCNGNSFSYDGDETFGSSCESRYNSKALCFVDAGVCEQEGTIGFRAVHLICHCTSFSRTGAAVQKKQYSSSVAYMSHYDSHNAYPFK